MRRPEFWYRKAWLALLAGSWCIAPPATAQNLIANGGFEDPPVPANDADGGVLITAPATLPGGWDLTAGSADVLRRNGATQYQTVEGLQALDLNGISRGTIRRSIATPDYAVYRLTFWIAGNPTCEVGIKRVNLLIEDTVFSQISFNTTGRSPTSMGWTMYEFTFPGLVESRVLQFQSTAGTNCGPMIDDVRLEKCLEVLTQPMSQTRCEGTTAVVSVATAGAGVQHRWRKGTQPLIDGGRISGAATPTLTITDLQSADAGTYSCQVFNDCGELASLEATLTIAPPRCPGDANGDHEVEFGDITRVLEFWGADYTPDTGPGDVTCDGVVSFADITRVLENWGISCL